MAHNLKLRALGLPTTITEKFEHSNIVTIQDFLFLNLIELQRKTGLTYQKLSAISAQVNSFVVPPCIQVSKLLNPSYAIFNDGLDVFLRGGITHGHITEFSGAPGLGKTQLCHELSISNTLHARHESNGVLYIDTEGAFTSSRLLEIAFHKYGVETQEKIESCLNRIHVWHPHSLKDIMDKLISIELLVIKERISLLIIDSMGSIVRRDFGAEKSVERSTQMCSLSSSLKQIAHNFNLAVVVTNHVTGKMETTSKDLNAGSTLIPALGPSWSHWINSRIHLFDINQNTRRLIVSKSPEIPEITVDYCINNGGVEIIYVDSP